MKKGGLEEAWYTMWAESLPSIVPKRDLISPILIVALAVIAVVIVTKWGF